MFNMRRSLAILFHFNPGGRVGTHIIIALIVFVGLAAIIIWVADWTSAAHDPQRLTFSIGVWPAARSTVPNTTRSASNRSVKRGGGRLGAEPCAISYYSSALWRRSARFASAAAV